MMAVVMAVVSGDNFIGAMRCAKLQSNRHHQRTIFYTPDALPVAQPQCQSTEGKISHSKDLLTPSSPGVFQLCL